MMLYQFLQKRPNRKVISGFFLMKNLKLDLAKFTLVGSANDGAYALSENVDNFFKK